MKRSVLRYWLLLFLPTLVISAAAFRLLRYEQDRIADSFQAAHSDRAQAVAQGFKQTVRSVEEVLLKSLKGLDPNTLTATLPPWVNQNPLVRNVFIWSSEKGLAYPQSDQTATREERRFVTRYAMLFDGRQPWDIEGSYSRKDVVAESGQSSSLLQKKQSGNQSQLPRATAREGLLELARRSPRPSSEAVPSISTTDNFQGGWLPWFADNRLYLIGWVRPSNRDLVWGVELELATLLSRLIIDFPQPSSTGTAYVLSDGAGRILHQASGEMLAESAVPNLTAPLTPILPHWQVAVYFNSGPNQTIAGRGFMIVAGLLVATVIAAILFGGILLYRDAERNRHDAERKTTFVANVSHELKTPLTSIRMYAELLKEGRVSSREKRGNYLQVIVDESRRLARLVNNLLDFSRLEQGRKSYRIKSLDLVAFLKEFDATHRLRIEKEDLKLNLELANDSVLVKTDRDVLEQVLLNLVDNAIKYAGDGKFLSITCKAVKSGAQITVSDRGTGIAVQDRERIFEKYFRTNDSLTAEHPGSGLGLAIARQLLRDIGGDLTYEANELGGSSFKVTIFEK